MGFELEIKDLGNLKYFLGKEIARSKEGIVSQRKYTLDLLAETSMLGDRPTDTPIEFNAKLENSGERFPIDKEKHQRQSRPGEHCQSRLGEHCQSIHAAPYKDRMKVVFKSNSRKSTSGCYTFVWGNLVILRSKKQRVVARSNVEAEYRATSLGICEEIWLQKVLFDLSSEVTKHVEIDRHFIKERLDNRSICILYIPLCQQVADALTKGLLGLPLRDRRKYLKDLFGDGRLGYFEYAKEISIEKDDACLNCESTLIKLNCFLGDAFHSSCEGIMVKSLDVDAGYFPSKRTDTWLKVKRDYLEGLNDSLDLVPIGAWHGNGRKAGWFSPFLMACYNPGTGEFQSVCRVMSGFSDAFYIEVQLLNSIGFVLLQFNDAQSRKT
ncbi:DNA ligase 1 isoform X3 [Cucumis melo var. makuwa]|uniref:DNA ligase 1 isoform X3 n=1 Tax=Cucumis melo var. makuwa TaxID=1194695 RepID=A0A5D3DZ11_CUCMM|nr:DNA ligase 1 isoform X3 [Cucumis melo var. makuwa]